MLLHRARDAERFVPAEEIHDAVWRTTIVSPTVMRRVHLLPLFRAGVVFADGVQQEGKASKTKARAA